MLFAVIIIPFALGILVYGVPAVRWRRFSLPVVAVTHAGLTFALYFVPTPAVLDGWLAVDDLGLFFLSIVSLIFLAVSFYTFSYLEEHPPADAEKIFISCMHFFLSAMSLTTLAQHLGLLWVAVEATTLVSAPLIYFHRSHRSLEATWKYLMICSVGIALALLGTFFLAAAMTASGVTVPLLLQDMIAAAPTLDSRWLQAAFIFLFVGYGTKMGLAPMHTWLPDAHSESPSPASALLSGVLLNCAFLGLLRMYQICRAAGQGAFAETMFMIFGLVSMLLASAFMIRQTDYKRLLAYSSVEHMGILSLAVGLGPQAAFFVLLHSLNHSLTKALLFLTSGNILSAYHSKAIDKVKGLLSLWPATGVLWVAGLLAISGTPPFGMFISEFNILGVALRQGRFVIAALYLFFLAVVFVTLCRTLLQMAMAEPPPEAEKINGRLRTIPMMVLLAMILMLGLYLPPWLQQILNRAALALGGGQ
jgi:hydrogenase-4 component F